MQTEAVRTPPEAPPASSGDLPGGRAFGLRPLAGLIGGPLLFALMVSLPPPAGLEPAGWRTAAVGVLMAVWWVTEAFPIAATALLPLVLFPLLGVAGIEAAAGPYANPLIFLFMGGFVLALGMERWGLHRRLALSVVSRIGTRPSSIVAGFMLAAALLSMWVSNTATALMMLPIGLSVIELARRTDGSGAHANFATALMLGIAYACSIGGMGTLVGTPTNALLAGFLAESYGVELSFAGFMLLGTPLVVVSLPLTFLVLTRLVFPIRLQEISGGREYIERKLAALGPMSRPEKMVGIVFACVALLWIFRPLVEEVVPGLSDTGIAVAGALLLFALPVDLRRGLFVLDWSWAERLPWGVLILFGGGLSLAAAINQTGLAAWIGSLTAGFDTLSVLALITIVTVAIVSLTELTSNTATAAAFLPIVASIAIGMGENPLLLAIPTTLGASAAFMLPVATPPNAIVYGSSFVTVPQMARAGLVLNVVFVVLITALTYVLLPLVLDVQFGTLPAWAAPAP